MAHPEGCWTVAERGSIVFSTDDAMMAHERAATLLLSAGYVSPQAHAWLDDLWDAMDNGPLVGLWCYGTVAVATR